VKDWAIYLLAHLVFGGGGDVVVGANLNFNLVLKYILRRRSPKKETQLTILRL